MVSARRRLQPGRASEYISCFADEIAIGDTVVVCCRVSRREQRRNLQDQEAGLSERTTAVGASALDVARHVGSGADPSWLINAADLARKHGAKLLAESTDRFIRHPGYHSEEWHDAQAREPDLEWLRWWTSGVTLVTLLPPDATPNEVRGYQSKRGQQAKGRTGGRPKCEQPEQKRERRERMLPLVLDLHKRGKSLGAIAAVTGVSKSTVQRWVGRYA